MNKVLLDTNILVYAKDASSKYNQLSLNLFSGEYQLFTTSKNLSEYFAVVTKGENPILHPLEARQDLEEFTALLNVIYPDHTSGRILNDLIRAYQPKGIIIHDFEIAAIAIAHGIKKIFTFDRDDFKVIKELDALQPQDH